MPQKYREASKKGISIFYGTPDEAARDLSWRLDQSGLCWDDRQKMRTFIAGWVASKFDISVEDKKEFFDSLRVKEKPTPAGTIIENG